MLITIFFFLTSTKLYHIFVAYNYQPLKRKLSHLNTKTTIMKKSLIIIPALALTMSHGANAQTFKQSGKTLTELCSENVTISAEGDFNKDGVKDLFISNNSGSAFYFGKTGGGYNLFHDYGLSVSENAKVTVNDKGVLRIQQDIEDGCDVFLFRYQDNCMRLIGGKKDRHKTSENYDISFNYLTSKMITTTGAGSSKQSETKDMEYLPILRFGWFPLKYDMLHYLVHQIYYDEETSTPEWKEAFGIFRLMQSGYFLFGFFNDYENEYHDISPVGKNKFEAEFITERPMVYNHSSTVSMEKLSDGTYKIHIEDAHRDRKYESIVDQYISEHPEDEDLDYDILMEKSGAQYPAEEYDQSESNYIFKDGFFIKQ